MLTEDPGFPFVAQRIAALQPIEVFGEQLQRHAGIVELQSGKSFYMRRRFRHGGARHLQRPIARLGFHLQAARLAAVADDTLARPDADWIVALHAQHAAFETYHGENRITSVTDVFARSNIAWDRGGDIGDLDHAEQAAFDRAGELRVVFCHIIECHLALDQLFAEGWKPIALRQQIGVGAEFVPDKLVHPHAASF
jgi:hypothetical protein